jgi:signal transduction histidine kinase
MNSTSAWKVAHKGLLIILGAFILATIASIIFLSYTLMKLDDSMTRSTQSYHSLRLLQDLMINLDEAETGSRGYILTGDQKYQDSSSAALKQIPQICNDLASSSQGLISQNDVKYLRDRANLASGSIAHVNAAKTSGDTEAAVQIDATGDNRAVMDQLRSKIGALTDAMLAEIRPRQAVSHDSVRRALSVAVAVSVFVVGICAVLIWYFQRSILRERALESTKSEFLSLASHQLRTPATNVKQYVGLLLDGYLGSLTKKQQDALEIAYKNNESEIRIMNDLLDVAKLDLKRIQLRKQRVNIVPVVKQVVKEFEQKAGLKGQTLDLQTPNEVIAKVDREYLKGVVEKLLDNAVKYSKDKTNISVKINIDDTLGVFEIIVKDQGLGIQKREVPKLFMKFSRIANEFSANSEGSGLGLYWVKQVMALHGGTVEVRTKEGRGSKFIVRAPLT